MLGLLKILEETESPINGKIQVVKTFEGTRIIAGGISQSGWLMEKVWNAAAKRIKKDKPDLKNILVLGLGGGSAATVCCKYWPDVSITGVDVDPVIVALGITYLGLGKLKNLEVVVKDALDFVEKARNLYDLILVDLFVGTKIPGKFRDAKFIQKLKKLLMPGGVLAFNHLYSALEKEDARKLEEKLSKLFPVLVTITPEANIIFLAYSK